MRVSGYNAAYAGLLAVCVCERARACVCVGARTHVCVFLSRCLLPGKHTRVCVFSSLVQFPNSVSSGLSDINGWLFPG